MSFSLFLTLNLISKYSLKTFFAFVIYSELQKLIFVLKKKLVLKKGAYILLRFWLEK